MSIHCFTFSCFICLHEKYKYIFFKLSLVVDQIVIYIVSFTELYELEMLKQTYLPEFVVFRIIFHKKFLIFIINLQTF